MFVQRKSNIGLEREPRAFENDFGTSLGMGGCSSRVISSAYQHRRHSQPHKRPEQRYRMRKIEIKEIMVYDACGHGTNQRRTDAQQI